MVSEQFHMDWSTVLVSSFGAIVVRCDGRGSGYQGTNLLHWIQKKLGLFEEQDQNNALKYSIYKGIRNIKSIALYIKLIKRSFM